MSAIRGRTCETEYLALPASAAGEPRAHRSDGVDTKRDASMPAEQQPSGAIRCLRGLEPECNDVHLCRTCTGRLGAGKFHSGK